MRLENWSIIIEDDHKYLAPELISFKLRGEVYGNKLFADGTIIHTSQIIGKDGELIITGTGSKYELGQIDQEYEKLYPNAKERLLNQLKERKK